MCPLRETVKPPLPKPPLPTVARAAKLFDEIETAKQTTETTVAASRPAADGSVGARRR
jgi:hypothetical protein